jgi:DNA-3-methyladenine glycosylase I
VPKRVAPGVPVAGRARAADGPASPAASAHAQASQANLLDGGDTAPARLAAELYRRRSIVAAGESDELMSGVVRGEDGVARCGWGDSAPEYRDYHDREWGFPVADDVRLFEKLSLEGFQSGLSWLTILRKREAFRRGFAGFDFHAVARFGERDVARLLADASIVRHRGKIEAVINNAARAVELVSACGSLAGFVWQFEPAPRAGGLRREAIEAHTEESRALAGELKRRGWRFVGPTTVHAFMQAMGLVNDHLEGCGVWADVERARAQFSRPVATAA